MPRLSSILIAATLSVLLGAMITIMIAWHSAYRYYNRAPPPPAPAVGLFSRAVVANTAPSPGPVVPWSVPMANNWPDFPDQPASRFIPISWAAEGSDQFASTGGAETACLFSLEVRRFGWPCTCLQSWQSTRSLDSPNPQDHGILRIPIPLASSRQLDLPCRPLWRNFATNTALFASPFLIGATAFQLLRRTSRRNAGCCLACGYDRTGLSAERPQSASSRYRCRDMSIRSEEFPL